MKSPFIAIVLAANMLTSSMAGTLELDKQTQLEEDESPDQYFGVLFPLFLWLYLGLDWEAPPLPQKL